IGALCSILGNKIQFHILIQVIQKILCLISDSIQLFTAEIDFSDTGRQFLDNKVQYYNNSNNNGCYTDTVGSVSQNLFILLSFFFNIINNILNINFILDTEFSF